MQPLPFELLPFITSQGTIRENAFLLGLVQFPGKYQEGGAEQADDDDDQATNEVKVLGRGDPGMDHAVGHGTGDYTSQGKTEERECPQRMAEELQPAGMIRVCRDEPEVEARNLPQDPA